ncbi:MAG: hypothetical protein F4X63_07620 [Nitrospira sp. SB0662_bin_26]|nr:hypothetical protein [Nitrospira sp. SB0662_bin_26]
MHIHGRLPIRNSDELNCHLDAFEEYIHSERTYEGPQDKTKKGQKGKFAKGAAHHRIRGARMFGEFLRGIIPEKKTD